MMGKEFTIVCRECKREKLYSQYQTGLKNDGSRWYGTLCATCRKVYGYNLYKRNTDRSPDERTMAKDIKNHLGFDINEEEITEIMESMGFDVDETGERWSRLGEY